MKRQRKFRSVVGKVELDTKFGVNENRNVEFLNEKKNTVIN